MLCAKAGEEMQQSEGGKRYKIGSYGAGALWCVSNRSGLFMLFNDIPIARRGRPNTAEPRDWISLHSAWKVTHVAGSGICVQHNDGEGVFVSLQGGANR